MKFSVVVPVYNSSVYLRECIESVLSQNYEDFEILIVDDGSNDGSSQVCDALCSLDKRIRSFHKENGGQFSARKCGIENANGDFIVPLDSDDMLRSDALQCLYDCIEAAKADLVLFNASREDSYAKPMFHFDFHHAQVFEGDGKRAIYEIIISRNHLNSFCMKAYARELLTSIRWDADKLQKLRNGEDLMQLLPVITGAQKIVYCKEVLYYYRPNTESISHRYTPSTFDSRKVIFDELVLYAKEWGICSDKSADALKLRTMRNIVSIVKNLRFESKEFQQRELGRISDHLWWREIYNSIDTKKLSLSERIILKLLYARRLRTLILWLKVYR